MNQTVNVNTGVLRKNTSLITETIKNVWITNTEKSKQYQIISSVYDGLVTLFEIDIVENTSATVTTKIPVQDLYVRSQGGTLLQHRSPLVYAMAFLNHPDLNFVDSVNLAKKEYTKFKNKFLELSLSLPNNLNRGNIIDRSSANDRGLKIMWGKYNGSGSRGYYSTKTLNVMRKIVVYDLDKLKQLLRKGPLWLRNR